MPQNLTDDKSTLVQVITRTSVEQALQRHMASLGHNELNEYPHVFACFV